MSTERTSTAARTDNTQGEGGRKPGTWDSEQAREAAKRSWEKRRARQAADGAAGLSAEATPQGEGRSEALRALYAVLGSRDAPHAAIVAAARALLDAEAHGPTDLPNSVAQVGNLSTEELHRVLLQLEGRGAQAGNAAPLPVGGLGAQSGNEGAASPPP